MLPTLDQLVLLVISVASAGLATAVYSRAPDRVWNRLFAVQALAMSVWVLLTYMLTTATSATMAGLWLRLTHPASALVICTFADIFWVFPERIEPAPLRRRLVLYGLGAFVSCLAFAPSFYTSLQISPEGLDVQFGWPFAVFGTFAVLTIVYADALLVLKFPRLSGLQRVQVGYVLAGAMIGQTLTLCTNVILPLIWNDTDFSRYGSASYIFVIGFMAYAIAKHGIIRPAAAINRAGGYLLTGAVLGALALAATALAGCLLAPRPLGSTGALAIGLAIGLLGVPVHRRICRRLERVLPGAHLAEAARSASDAILRTLDGEQLPGFLCGAVLQMLKATHVSVYSRDSRTGAHMLRSRLTASSAPATGESPEMLPPHAILIEAMLQARDLLDRGQIRRFGSLREAQPVLAVMRQLDVEVVAPILWEGDLIGLVLIGERLAGDIYEPNELQMLRNLLPQVSLAVRNAQLFDEVVRMKEYNENILRQMQSGVIAVNADREIVTFNPAAEEILGLRADQVVGRSLEVLPEDIAARLALALSGHGVRSEDRLVVEDGSGRRTPVACSTSRWRGSPLSQEGAIAVISDLTLVEELEHERRDAEHLATIRMLSAGMAHELRNPLVAIRTFAELLPTRWDDDEFRVSFLGTAQDEIERIDRLLTDLLMLSKPADAVVESLNVDQVCEGVLRTMSAGAEAREVKLLKQLRFGNSYPIMGDRGRLHQALINLVKNAIEAEPPGGLVQVTTLAQQNGDASAEARIVVHNSGSYIPADQIEKIFQPFWSKRQGGTGLGLPVCQTIIEEHSGVITVRSTPEAGTDFIVQLPASAGSGESSYGRSASQ